MFDITSNHPGKGLFANLIRGAVPEWLRHLAMAYKE